MTLDFTDACRVLQLEGTLPTLPGASHSYDSTDNRSLDSWALDDLPNPRAYTLTTNNLGTLVSEAQSPILTLRDLSELGLALLVQHQDPVPTVPGYPTMTTTETVTMIPVLDPDEEDDICRLLRQRPGRRRV